MRIAPLLTQAQNTQTQQRQAPHTAKAPLAKFIRTLACIIGSAVCMLSPLSATTCYFPTSKDIQNKGGKITEIVELNEILYEDFFFGSDEDESKSEGVIKTKTKIMNPFDISLIFPISPDTADYDEQPLVEYLDKLGSKDFQIKTRCEGSFCTTEGYNEKDNIYYEANCKNGKLHGKQIVKHWFPVKPKDSNDTNDSNKYKKYNETPMVEIEFNYRNNILHGKQKIANRNYQGDPYSYPRTYETYEDDTQFDMQFGVLHGKYTRRDSYGSNSFVGANGISYTFVNGIAVGEYYKSKEGSSIHNGSKFLFAGNYNQKGKLHGTQTYRHEIYDMIGRCDLVQYICTNNQCVKEVITWRGSMGCKAMINDGYDGRATYNGNTSWLYGEASLWESGHSCEYVQSEINTMLQKYAHAANYKANKQLRTNREISDKIGGDEDTDGKLFRELKNRVEHDLYTMAKEYQDKLKSGKLQCDKEDD